MVETPVMLVYRLPGLNHSRRVKHASSTVTDFHLPLCQCCFTFGAVLWVGDVDVYNVGSPLFVCACYVGTLVCVFHSGCLNDN